MSKFTTFAFVAGFVVVIGTMLFFGLYMLRDSVNEEAHKMDDDDLEDEDVAERHEPIDD